MVTKFCMCLTERRDSSVNNDYKSSLNSNKLYNLKFFELHWKYLGTVLKPIDASFSIFSVLNTTKPCRLVEKILCG